MSPMLIGIIPFGLVAGTTPAEVGLSVADALGFSIVVFAGASQLAAIDVLSRDGSALLAAIVAWTINLRMLLYSASLAPFLTAEPLRRRLLASYFLVDQNYADSVTRWARADHEPASRLPFFLGGGLLVWTGWVLSTAAGAMLGSTLPDDLPLDFAVPLVFLVLLVPAITSRPGGAAAAAGGIGTVVALEAGAGSLSIVLGALTGIVAGVLAELATERRTT